MKTHALRSAILTFFAALLTLSVGVRASASPSSGFFTDALGMAGVSSKGNGYYLELADQIFAEFKKTRAPFLMLSGGEKPAYAFQQDFENYCMDGDSADIVSWITSGDSSRKITFSCVLDGEVPRIRERLFVFTIRDGRLADIQVASADIAAAASNSAIALINSSQRKADPRDLPVAKPWNISNGTDKVIVAVSGAMISGGITAGTTSTGFQAKDLTTREAGAGALVSGLGAAVSHYVFNMAPATSGLAGGGLTIALADMNDNIPDPLTGLPRGRVERKGDGNGGLGPITLHFTFKF